MIKVLDIALYDKGIMASVKETVSIIESLSTKNNLCNSAEREHGLTAAKFEKDLLPKLENNNMILLMECRMYRLESLKKSLVQFWFLKYTIQKTPNRNIHHHCCSRNKNIAEELIQSQSGSLLQQI